MDFPELLTRLALALGIGLLIGLERGWRAREQEAGSRAAGIRTFSVTGILGGTAGALAQAVGGGAGGGLIVGLSLAAYAGVMAVFCLEENRAEQRQSATTWAAATLTFALGAYAVLGDTKVAAALAVAAAIVLALREYLHGWLERLTWPELRSALVLLAMTFLALPVIPDVPVGPFGGVDLREVWVIAIALAGISFLGYAAVKFFGPRRGVLLAGLAGGLASSTAVTITNARRAASGEGSAEVLSAGVSLASATMFLRVCAVVVAINPGLLGFVAPPLVVAAAVAIGLALFAAYRPGARNSGMGEVQFRNPFGFWSVIGFAVLLGVVIVLGRAIGDAFGATGAMVGAALIGLADVDSVTVSTARLVPAPLSAQEASLAILVAVTTNTLSKIGIGAAIGRGRFALEIAAMALACLVAGALAVWVSFALIR